MGRAWQRTGLVFPTRYGTPMHDARRTWATLLADLDVHPRVAMQILRHAQFSITMEIYTQVSSKATRDALKRLGESLGADS